jgi:hypothetical protein
MDATLKKVLSWRQTCDLELAALKHSGPGYRHLAKAAGAFGYRVLSGSIELRYEASPKVLHLGERMRLAALVDYAESCFFVDVDRVRFKVPVRVRMSRLCLRKQVRQRREISQRDILTEARPKRCVEGFRIAFVQGYDLAAA